MLLLTCDYFDGEILMFVGFDGEILMLFGFAFLAEIIAGIFMSLLRIGIFIGCYLMI
jgi:hypothetical protein